MLGYNNMNISKAICFSEQNSDLHSKVILSLSAFKTGKLIGKIEVLGIFLYFLHFHYRF